MSRFFLAMCGGLLLAGAAVGQPSQSLEAAEALARKSGCMSCHGMVHKQVGPGFAQVAARYRNDPVAPERLAGRIRNGSVGSWGRVIMPQQTQVNEAQARQLAQWVLAQSPPP